MATTDKKEELKASGTCMVVQNEKISTKNGESQADNIVRGSNIPILTSHAGLNPRSKPGNESSFAGELSRTELEQILENPFIKHIEYEDEDYFTINGILYSRSPQEVIRCPIGKTGHVKIAEGTLAIAYGAFQFCEIESVEFPDSIVAIADRAFRDCRKLNHVDFGKGIKDIGGGNLGEPFSSGAMFNGCRSLQYIDIPENIKYISSNCFSNSGLTSVTLHEGLETIDSGAFNCPIQNVEIPKSVKNIDLWNFPMLDEANIKTHSMPAITSIVKSNCKKWNCRSNMADLKINIDCMAYPVFVPAKLTSAGLRRLNSLLNKALFRDTDSDDVNQTTFLSITSDPRIKQRLALKMYDAVECNEIKAYLRRAGKSIAEWMILDKDEEALIQFLKKDIITVNTIDKLIPQMDAAEMINAKAYAMEYIRKSTKEKSFRI